MPKLWGKWLKTAESTQVEREVAEDSGEKRRKKEKRWGWGVLRGRCPEDTKPKRAHNGG